MRQLSLRARLAVAAGCGVLALTAAGGGVGFAAYRTIRTQSDYAEANAALSEVNSRVGRTDALIAALGDVSTDPASVYGLRRELQAQGVELQRYAQWLDGARAPAWSPSSGPSNRTRRILVRAAAETSPQMWVRLDQYAASALQAAQPGAKLALGELIRGDMDAGYESLLESTEGASEVILSDQRRSMESWRHLIQYGVLAFAATGVAVTLLVLGPLGVLLTRQREQEKAAVRARLDAARYMTQVMNGVDVGIIAVHNGDDGQVTLNQAARRLLGLEHRRPIDRSALIGWVGLREPASGRLLGLHELPLQQVLAGHDFGPRQLLISSDAEPGEPRHVVVRGVPLRDHDGLPVGALVTFQDVSELHVTNDLLLQKAAELGAISEATRAVLRGTDARESVCEAAGAITGAQVVSIFEADPHGDLVCTSSIGADFFGMRVARDSESVLSEVFASAKPRTLSASSFDGTANPHLVQNLVDARGTRLTSGAWIPVVAGGRVLAVLTLGFTTDVDARNHLSALEILATETAVAIERQDLLRRLEAEAETDPLTGAANRRALDQELAAKMGANGSAALPLSVIMLDLDHFKQYNDQYGHAAGDALLRAAVQAWRSRLRPADVLARYGGEEFTVVLPDCSSAAAVIVADALRSLLPQAQTCSAGVATWDGHETPARILRRADEALYAAKASGRDRTTVWVAGSDRHSASAARSSVPASVPAGLQSGVHRTDK